MNWMKDRSTGTIELRKATLGTGNPKKAEKQPCKLSPDN